MTINPLALVALSYSLPAACAAIGCGRTTMYRFISEGRIEARTMDGRTVIVAESLRQFVANLPPANIRAKTEA